jgi:hypothetical protein
MIMTALTTTITLVQKNPLLRLYRHYVIDSVLILKRRGLRELVRQRRWKFLLLIAGYYLVRDTIFYVAIPLLVARGLI